jgi:dipeptidyl-peptidase-4
MKRTFLSLITGLIVMALVAQEAEKTLNLENVIRRNAFRAEGIYGLTSLADGQHYCSVEGGSIIVYSYETGEVTDTLVHGRELIPPGAEEPISLKSYSLSRDEMKVLIPTETESIYRWSEKSLYYVWDIEKKTLSALSTNGKQRLADFSPDGNMVAFVRDNNLFIKDLVSGEENMVTDDGKAGHIINGTTDWVYEEEFGFTKGFSWSPDGSKIAYYRFDESDVMEYGMQMWGELYPEIYRYKYPKAGEKNSLVSIHVYDLEGKSSISVDLGDETDQYIPRIEWTLRPDILAIQRMNRLQNHLEILLADAVTGKTRVTYNENNRYYIEITDHLTFTDRDHFIITSETDGYCHIYYHHLDNGPVGQLTKGEWDVTDVLGYDHKRKRVIFEAARSSPLNREVLAAGLDGKISTLSAGIGWNSARFSSNYDYFILTFSDANTPPYITVNNASGKEIRVVVTNEKLKEKLIEYGYRSREFFTIPAEGGVMLNAWKILPPDFDPTKKYPVLMYVYGGPGSQTVENNWDGGYLWYQMLAQNGIVCVSVDNRGTGARGETFKKMTYLQLGKYETIDQIAAAKYLAEQPWVDEGHMGIFGWSYGGFMSTLCMTKGADIFDVGIAVAPVTNWKYYDNIYTERFMRTPQENPGGYEDNSPINFTDGLAGKYLLVHGTADDNVHVQNAIDLVTALVASDKQFEMQFYPNRNHSIYGGNTRYHLYTRMTDFLLDNLKK